MIIRVPLICLPNVRLIRKLEKISVRVLFFFTDVHMDCILTSEKYIFVQFFIATPIESPRTVRLEHKLYADSMQSNHTHDLKSSIFKKCRCYQLFGNQL